MPTRTNAVTTGTKKAAAGPAPAERGQDVGSRRRILDAALEEFSAMGYAGARIERITAAAGVNVRMIYHHFGGKRELLEAVLSDIFLHRKREMASLPEALDELLLFLFDGYAADRKRVRLLEWEALEATAPSGDRGPARELTDVAERRVQLQRRVDVIRRAQADDGASASIEPEMLYLIMVALAIYPMSFPQSVRIAINEDPESESFRSRYRNALRSVGRILFQDQLG